MHPHDCGKHAPAVIRRRGLLQAAGLAGMSWLTPLGSLLAQQNDRDRKAGDRRPAQSVILLWLAGGPSQLETFDPHPGAAISEGTVAIDTALKGVQLAKGYEQLAAEMESVSLIRSLTSKEGDHERGSYTVKTGYEPDPTAVHPSIGAILCHNLPVKVKGEDGVVLSTEIPRHVSILPNQWPGRGGFLGDQYDAFKTWDPIQSVPDVKTNVPKERMTQRLSDLDVVERAFARGRLRQTEGTLHRDTVAAARTMMDSSQIKAFDVRDEAQSLRDAYGDTAFGRGCLAARRLIEVGVRCVEVTLSGWDTHAKNHEGHLEQARILDPAFATLLRDLRERKLLDRTVVVCVGEFGRTPKMNGVGGRDHWPHNFSLAIAGGGLAAGRVIGETDPAGGKEVKNPVKMGDVHATILAALGIDHTQENISPVQRPIRLARGEPIPALWEKKG
jgi:hypothetical protein